MRMPIKRGEWEQGYAGHPEIASGQQPNYGSAGDFALVAGKFPANDRKGGCCERNRGNSNKRCQEPSLKQSEKETQEPAWISIPGDHSRKDTRPADSQSAQAVHYIVRALAISEFQRRMTAGHYKQ